MLYLSYVLLALMSYMISGRLEQILGSQAVCEDDEAVFICTNDIGAVVWEINIRGTSSVATFSFGHFFRTPFIRTYSGPSMITGHVANINSTFIKSIVTFSGAIYLNQSIVTCDGDRIAYIIEQSFNRLPTQLVLTPYSVNTSDFYFVLPSVITSDYQIDIIPSPLIGPMNITSTDLLVGLVSNSQYNITVSWSECPHQIHQTFKIGRCPFIFNPLTLSVIQYNIGIDAYSAVIKCSYDNTSFVIGCEQSCQWNNSFDVCTSNEAITTALIDHVNETKIASVSTTDKSGFITYSSSMLKTGISTTQFASSLVGSVSLVFLVGIGIGTLIGIRMGLYIASRKMSQNSNVQINIVDGPLYDEVDLDTKTKNITISQNVAYGHSTMHIMSL